MKKINKVVMFFNLTVLVFVTSMISINATSAAMTVDVDLNSTGSTAINNPWNVLNSWFPVNTVPDLKTGNPFLRSVCIFNATGGFPAFPQYELYDEDENGNPVYNFTSLESKINTILNAGLKPYIVLGGSPVKMASNPNALTPEYKCMTCKVKDYDKYRMFIKALFDSLDSEYGSANVAGWKFRFMTEPNNPEWWTESMDEWFKFYDYAVSGARLANPDVRISPGNFSIVNCGWIEQLASRIQNGIFSIAGEQPYAPSCITFSFYEPWTINDGESSSGLSDRIKTIRGRLAPYPLFNDIPLGIDEGYIAKDETGKVMWAREDNTEYGAAHIAYLSKILIQNNFSHASLWVTGSKDCPEPARNVMDQVALFNGMSLINATVGGSAGSGNEFAVFAAKKTGEVRIMLVNFNRYRASGEDESITVNLHNVNNTVNINHQRVDKNHGNFIQQWLLDTDGLNRDGSSSKYDLSIFGCFSNSRAARTIYNQNLNNYKYLSGNKTIENKDYTPVSGNLRLTFPMPAQSVSFIVVSNIEKRRSDK